MLHRDRMLRLAPGRRSSDAAAFPRSIPDAHAPGAMAGVSVLPLFSARGRMALVAAGGARTRAPLSCRSAGKDGTAAGLRRCGVGKRRPAGAATETDGSQFKPHKGT